MSDPISITLESVNLSRDVGEIKQAVSGALVNDQGLVGDAHAGPWHRQVSLLSQSSVERFSRQLDRKITPGEFAENITLSGIDYGQYALLDRLRFGSVELEVTQLGKACHGSGCAIFTEVGACVMPTEGVFARVVHGGSLRPGLQGSWHQHVLPVHVISMSDRAASGSYEDLSGAHLENQLRAFFGGGPWRASVEREVLPDDPEQLELALDDTAAHAVIFTTGGTGIGPRDITPEVVTTWCDKLIPGLMEGIRVKYGMQTPQAWLSRSVAGIKGRRVIFALPGSLKAVKEYLGEIELVLSHLLLMLHGIDAHEHPPARAIVD